MSAATAFWLGATAAAIIALTLLARWIDKGEGL